MYCSSCGASVNPGLSYCNHCGAKVSTTEDAATLAVVSADTLVWAIVVMVVAGFPLILALLATMKQQLNFNTGLIIFFACLSFLILLGAEATLISVFLSRRKDAKAGRDAAQLKESEIARELDTRKLNEEPLRKLAEPVPSVTEPTTRAFEPILQRRKVD
jgi:predicted amidophosphoribosyltransferase